MAQFKYRFEKYEFKQFLLDDSPDRFRSEKFIFWVGKIPLPDDLIFKLFDERGGIISIYIDHIISIIFLILAGEAHNCGVKALEIYPDESNPSEITKDLIKSVLKKNRKVFSAIEHQVSDVLLIDGYSIDYERIYLSLSHKGKKYNRIFLPKTIRDIIGEQISSFDYNSFRAQSDMFGNHIADLFEIYRSGFSDALSGLFNKLIEFIILGATSSDTATVRVGDGLSISSRGVAHHTPLVNFEIKPISDGCLWEPALVSQTLGFSWDNSILELFEGELGFGGVIMQVLSEMELQAYKESERKKIEYIRKDISRLVKSRLEENKKKSST